MAASKMKTFGNGTPYVEAGGWAVCFAWLVDFIVYLVLVAVGFVILAVIGEAASLSPNVGVVGLLALVVFAPALYGLCYRNGRGLGAIWAGTRLVRLSDGGRIGAKGPWAMTVRLTLLPLIIVGVVAGGGYAPDLIKRVSIDVARTRRLLAERQAGYLAPRV
ncbi:hypothetical protein GCM10009830_48160 [Glycomyces endophyticus]|uniref:RDD family protein n=1 Tax=Glycomyces endophyticus TaxID=480996 RepID=A0ABP4TXL1_9ACTN